MARRMLLVSVVCMVLTWGVIYNAFRQKGEFYPSVVYLTKSRPSMAVLYAQAFVFIWLAAQLMKKLFFGTLRSAEAEHMVEQFWYAVPETCLMFTAFREDLSPSFVAIVTFLFVIKAFHWLAEDRIDYMERSPVITLKFHARASSLLLALGTVDAFLLHYAFNSVMAHGPSVQLVFGLEYAILLIMLVGTMMKYILHTIDLQNENPWENKVVYMLYADVVLGFLKVSLYFAFMSFMLHVHMFPLYIMRRTYLAVKSFKKSVSDVILSRKAIANLNRYPDVTPEELQNIDNVCIICREEMTTQVKRLPCNHIFHLSCLRSWFQRQQTCPTCRESVLRRTAPTPAAAAAARQQRAANNQGVADRPPFPPPGFPPPHMMWPGMFPPQAAAPPPQGAVPPPQDGAPPPPQGAAPPPTQAPPPQQGADQPQQGAATSNEATANGTNLPPAAAATPTGMFPPFMMPPPFPPPFFMPGMAPNMGAAPPINLAALSDEELRQLEGVERQNMEARIRLLQRIQSLLDSAVTLMGQYSTVATTPMGETTGLSMAASNFVSQTSQPYEAPVQASSQLLVSSTAAKSEGIPINKLLPAEESSSGGDNKNDTAGQGGDVNTRLADSSEIRKRRLEKLASKEAVDQPQQAESEDDKSCRS